jgi:hypothetical protein
MWDAGTMRWLPDGFAGLPRRCAPRNDNGESGGRGGARSLDCRVATLLAMTTGGSGGRGGRVPVFGRIALRCHCESVRAWQSSLMRYAGCRDDAMGCRMVPLDCRVATLLAMTKREREWAGWFVPVFGCVPQGCHCEPVRSWQSSRGRYTGCPAVRLDRRVRTSSFLAMTK